MEPFNKLTAQVVAIPADHIDTDQIIPARFLKTISKTGLGKNLFADWRYDSDGAPNRDFPLNQPQHQGAQILLAGDNFGCGSSREHAPWALTDFGFRAIISTSFADIFRNNALKNGLLPLVVDDDTHRQLMSLAAEEPELELSIDLDTQSLILPTAAGFNSQSTPSTRPVFWKGWTSWGTSLSTVLKSKPMRPNTGPESTLLPTHYHDYIPL